MVGFRAGLQDLRLRHVRGCLTQEAVEGKAGGKLARYGVDEVCKMMDLCFDGDCWVGIRSRWHCCNGKLERVSTLERFELE